MVLSFNADEQLSITMSLPHSNSSEEDSVRDYTHQLL